LGLLGEVVCLRDAQLGSWRLHDSNLSRRPITSRIRDYHELHAALEELVRKHPEIAERLGSKRMKSRYARCHFMGGFYAGLDREWKLARREFSTAFRIEKSVG